MATTTPNYGWTVPTSTDLVKDGATAIETLGDAIDASMNTALGTKKAGMVLLNTTSFSAVASQTINQFSATYSHYLVLHDLVLSASNQLRLRFTDSAGSVLTGANYAFTSNYAATSIAHFSDGVGSSEILMYIANPEFSGTIDFFNPFTSALKTKVVFDTAGQTDMRGFGSGTYTSAVQNNGFQLYPAAGTMTGTVSVYGYNK